MYGSEIYDLACKDFLRNQKNAIENISSAVLAGDLSTACFYAHSLKGVAGLIEETTLAELAGIAENAFRKGEVPTDTIDSLANEMSQVWAKISQNAPGNDSQTHSLISDKSVMSEVFDKAVLLLNQHSFDIVYMLDEISKIPQT